MGQERQAAARRALQWKAHIDAWQASGQTQTGFCKANRLKYANFCYELYASLVSGVEIKRRPGERSHPRFRL
jgi:hypothetical protein